MNRIVLISALSLAGLIPILHIDNPVIQAGLLWVVMQLAIQFAFGIVPNALKVAVIACSIIVVIQFVWYKTTAWATKENFETTLSETIAPQKCGGLRPDDAIDAPTPAQKLDCVSGCDDVGSTDCWSDPEKKINRKIENLLQESAKMTREIEQYLRVDEPDQRA